MKPVYLSFIVVSSAILLSEHGFSQSDTVRRPVGEVLSGDALMVLKDAGTVFSAPTRFSRNDWLTMGAVVGGTALLFAVDVPGRTLAQRNHSSFNDAIFNAGKEYGNPIYGGALSCGLYAAGLALDKKDLRQTGVMVMESMAFAGAVTTVLKTVAGRSRPFLEEGNTRFRGFQFKDGTTSLPSGHATVAFSVSSVLAERVHNIYVGVGLYALATVTAVSRVYHDEHWVSDSFLGGAIGTGIGIAVSHLHDDGAGGTSFRVEPSDGGFSLEFVF